MIKLLSKSGFRAGTLACTFMIDISATGRALVMNAALAHNKGASTGGR